MKKTLLLLSIILFAGFSNNETPNSNQTEATVYICTGQYAKRYHKTDNCEGIKSCRAKIKKVTITEAKKQDRTECKICYSN